MKRLILCAVALGFAFVALAAQSGKPDAESEKAKVRLVLEKYVKTLEAEDLEQLAKLFAQDEDLVTVVPSRDAITDGVDAIRDKLDKPAGRKHDAELQMLQRALEVERETSNFYREMVQTMDEVGRNLFQRFLEIEEGHQAIVQAEIDCVSGTGYWFDIPEFKLG